MKKCEKCEVRNENFKKSKIDNNSNQRKWVLTIDKIITLKNTENYRRKYPINKLMKIVLIQKQYLNIKEKITIKIN